MSVTDQGVYLQFFDEGEVADRELPPLGPFELLIVRHNRIIGDREAVEHDVLGAGSVERWLEAELELRRALGDEPGGVRRSHMRIRASRGDIIVRFYDYAGDEAPRVPELGPFYALTVGKREVRADDKLLAIRSTDMSPWTLTDAVRPGIAGINKADFSVFSLSVRDPRSTAPSPQPPLAPPIAPPVAAARPTALRPPAPVAPAPPTQAAPTPLPPVAPSPVVPPPPVMTSAPTPDAAPPAALSQSAASEAETIFIERRKIQREIYVARPLPHQDEQLTPADVNLILRVDKLKQQELAQQLMVERLRKQQHADPEIALRTEAVESLPMRFQPPVKERGIAVDADDADAYEDVPFTERLLGFLWSARLVIITLLILIAALSAYGYVRGSATPTGPIPVTFAAMGSKVSTPDWTISVDSLERTLALGTVRPTAGSLLIVHITATKKNGDAVTLDPSEFALLDPVGGISLPFSPTSEVYSATTGLTWPTRYAVTVPTRSVLVFDVNPGARSLLFLIKSVNVEVRLPDP